MSRKKSYTLGSGNVFADLELPDAEELLAKAGLARRISEVIRRRGLTQTQAAAVLGVDQPKISALVRGRLSGFSFERLLRFLLRLGQDVRIVVRAQRRARRPARLRVA